MKTIHTTKAKNNAETESMLLTLINRADIKENRKIRARKKLEKYYSERILQGVWVAIGNTYNKKEELKKDGFIYCSGSQIWYSRERKVSSIEGVEMIKG
jgi:hypothetical protein